MTNTRAAFTSELVNILLVDDRPENLMALSATLKNPDYRIVTADSGRQALSCLLKEEFALVILDVMMPDMDGYQVAALMKQSERTRHIPIIFLTAIANDVSFIFKGYSMGAVDYLMKPLDAEIVKAKTAVFVDLFRSKQQIKKQADALREIERQAQETKLLLQRQESEAWYSTTLRSIGDAVIATDLENRVRFLNPVAETLTGWTFAEARGQPVGTVFRIINEETREQIGNPATVDLADHFVLISRQGSEYFLEVSGAPIRTIKNELLGVVIVFRDGTEKRREADRKSLVSKATSILLSTLDYSTTLNGVARLAVTSIVDCCVVDLVAGENEFERIAVAHHDSQKEALIKTRTGLGLQQVERAVQGRKTVFINDFPELRDLDLKSCVAVPLFLRGNVLGVMTFFVDSSKRKISANDISMFEDMASRAAIAIENARLYEGAQKAIRLRDEFLSIASHELRTPITPLKLHLELLKRLSTKDMFRTFPLEKLSAALDIADSQLERFQRLIDELLDVSRISVGRLKIERERVDLESIVREIVNQFSEDLNKANCPLELETTSAVGNWDKLRVEQVLINLLANAIKYGAGKSVKVTIENTGHIARLKVEDHGLGITVDDQKRIFDRFERAASVRHFPGLGLGLYITKQIVEAHSGGISVESDFGHGTTFIVELPLEELNVRVA